MEKVKVIPDNISETRQVKVSYVKFVCNKCGNSWGSTVDTNTNTVRDRDTICMVCAVSKVKNTDN